MRIVVDGVIVDVRPGQTFVSDGKVFGLCKDCGRIIRVDGWTRGVHLCQGS